MEPFATLDRLLEHVIDVEREMVDLSAQAHRQITGWISESGTIPGNEVLEALQYQDILSQQLSATTEAIGSIREHLGEILSSSCEQNAQLAEAIGKVDAKLLDVLRQAEAKRLAYRGRSDGESYEEIEFF